MSTIDSFVRVLAERARETGQRRAFTYLADGESQEEHLTYGELDRLARAIGALLQSTCTPGARVVLLYPPGLQYIAAFFGCLYGGFVAVPAYPPDPSRLQRTLPRLQAIVGDAQAEVVLTTQQIASMTEALAAFAPDLARVRWMATDALDEGLEASWRPSAPDSGTLAFLQYTSGSTGTPKGVMLTHGNLLANERAIQEIFALDRQSVGVGWLPLYHDMGLIGNVLQTTYTGFHCVLMSPLDFLQRPLRWLEAISRYRGTTSGAPNFAYDLAVRKSTPEARAALDLSSWSLAFTGAEPVRRESLERFATAFAASGFRRQAFLPCYGLAEATLIVCGKPTATDYVVAALDSAAMQGGVAVAAREGEASKELVSCGRAVSGTEVRVVDPATCLPCVDGRVGEIWVTGPHVARGYWNDPEKTRSTFEGRLAKTSEESGAERYLRTGDLGFVRDGEIFVSGRLKDLIIVRGRNYYPQDIEAVVERSAPMLRQGSTAAFSLEIDGEERVVVVAEALRPKPGGSLDLEGVLDAIRAAVAEALGLSLHEVALVEPGAIPKTSSGKIQRHACKAGYLAGTLAVTCGRAASTEPVAATVALTHAALAEAATTARLALVEEHLRAEVARAMRVTPHVVDLAAPLVTLGLDSLQAVEVAHALERSMGVEISLTEFLRDTSGLELAKIILARLPAARSAAPAPAAESDAPFALSAGQESLWFMHMLAPSGGAGNIGTAFDLRGDVSVLALRATFRRLIERHPALASRFEQIGDRLVQRAHADGLDVEVVDVAGWTDSAVRQRATDEVERRFDLEQGPMCRMTVLVRDPRACVLVLAAHHAVADLASLVVLLSELRALYPSARDGLAAPALPPSASYRAFVAWEEAYLRDRADADWAYWRERLEGVPDLELPTDRARPAVKTFRGASVPVSLPRSLVTRIGALARGEATTAYAVVLAAFQLTMARYSDQESFLVGSPATVRPGASYERTVGYFVNPLALRADLTGEPTARELVRRTRDTGLGALEHRSFPFARAVERLRPVRDPSRTPLFQTMFVLEKAFLHDAAGLTSAALDTSTAVVDFAGLELRSFSLARSTAVFDLTLNLVHDDELLQGALEYNADLFDRETVERLAAHFATLLEGLVARPDETVWKLPLLTEAERHRVLVEWQGTPAPRSTPSAVHVLFEAQARERPEALALTFQRERLTYAELNRRANQLAHWLMAHGVGVETRVVTWLDRSPAMVIAALAVMKAGGTYVPVDPAVPLARVAFNANDAEARLVLSTRAVDERSGDPFAGAGAGAERRVVVLDDASLQAELATASVVDPNVPVHPRHAAYVIYTSGTSGEPKGSFAEHRQLAALVGWYHRYYEVRPADRLTQIAGPAFDASVYEIWPALLGGASLHIVPDEMRRSADRLRAWLVAEAITLCFAPTALAELLLDETEWQGAALRFLLAAGDRLTRRPGAHHPFRVTNGYGPSECTIQATVSDVEADASGRPPSIGRPIDGVFVYVLDRHLEPAPIGVPGEIVIGGDAVSRGYLRRPALTAEKFVADPFRGVPGACMYRTGDIARHLPDGSLAFIGRVDGQVKLRGLRIELGEIESTLLSHESVREAAVTVREDVPGRKQLVAYVAGRAGAKPLAAALSVHLQRTLPAYMVPSAFVVLDALPLTNNGKTDRQALPAPARPAERREALAAHDTVESRLCTLTAEVLGVARVGVHEKFFEMGASSLDLMKLQRRIERDFEVRVPVTAFFERSSVQELAPLVRGVAGERVVASSAPAAAAAPMSIAIIGMAGRFPGAESVPALWERVLAGHDCLTRFTADEARPSPLLPEGAAHPRFMGAEGILDATGVDQELWRPSADTRGLDLQSKLFLDTVLAAFEDAGHDPWAYPGRVALYGGASSLPLVEAIVNKPLAKRASALWASMAHAPDTLPMRAAHTFGFRAEAMNVNTACSTGLSAVHLACQSLLSGSSDAAVAVAANVPSLQGVGYVREEGTILSHDSVVRPFDARATGVVIGHGVGAVLLKPLDAALRDGDRVYAVIRATATNNDGRAKVGYTAPGVSGQADVVAAAHARAGISADRIGYVETHGTGTRLGDPVELDALTNAFRRSTDKRGFCAIGAVKANVGHLDSAAGLVGLMKAALVLHHQTLPPLTNFESPNPELALEGSPFTLPLEARAWTRGEGPRMAAVSSFGIGGTNVHAVLEEAPMPESSSVPARAFMVALLGARTSAALEVASHQIASLAEHAPGVEVADLVYTLNTRRLRWPLKRAVVGADGAALARALREPQPARRAPEQPLELAFVYSGMGSNPAGLGASLYATEPVFRERVDACQSVLLPSGFDVRAALVEAPVSARLPVGLFGAALFSFEIALDGLLASWGIRPACVLGHSLGEYAAAVTAGVMSLDDALAVVAARCHGMQAMPEGAMLVAMCGGDRAVEHARRPGIGIAAVNGPNATVFCGDVASVEELQKELRVRRVASMLLPVDRALHSRDVEVALPALGRAVSAATLRRPALRFVSTVEGGIVDQGLTAPAYWANQMRNQVEFAAAVAAARESGVNVFVEIGPTGGLVPVMAGNLDDRALCLPAFQGRADGRALYDLVARLVELDAPFDWGGWYAGESRRHVHAPLHPRPLVDPVLGTRAQHSPPITVVETQPAPSLPAMNTTSIEDQISTLWKKALELEKVDRQAHFLELGGSSLLAVQLVADLRDAFGLDIGLAEVFATPTVQGLAQLVTDKLAAAPHAPVPPPRPAAPVSNGASRARLALGGAPAERRLSAVQRRVLAADADPSWGPVVVNMAGAVRVRGVLEPQRLARALKAVVRRHDVLHTKVRRRGAAVELETVFKPSDVQLGTVWCDAVGMAERLDEVRSAICERVAQPFDLAREIPLRAFLFQIGAEDHVLALVVHHIAADAPSLKILLHETVQSYLGVALPEQGPSYAAFAARQAEEIAGSDGAAHVAHLSALIDRSPRLLAAVDSSNGARADASLSFTLGADVGGVIAELRRARGQSTFVVVAAALAVAMKDILQSSELVLSTPWSNRDRAEHAGLVGYVAHCMVMNVDLAAGTDPIAAVQRSFDESLRHTAVPFEHAVLLRDDGARPLSDLCLVVHEETEQPLRVGGLDVELFPYEREGELQAAPWVATMGTVGFLVQLRPDGSGGRMSFTFPRSLAGDLASELPSRLGAALRQMRASAGGAVSGGRVIAPPRSPLALHLDGVALSHAEVEALTSSIATKLAARCVVSDDAVDVAYRNRAELVCAVRAILRVGARAALGRDDASTTLSFAADAVDGERIIAFELAMPLGRTRARHLDAGAAPVAKGSLERAAAMLLEVSGSAGPHVVWDEALPDNRAVALAVAATNEGGLVSDLPAVARSARVSAEPLPLSLAFFAVDDAPSGEDTYRLLLEGAKLADEAGLRAVFAPERHFHPFGGAFPDPTVVAAALASVTKRIQLRAGSIVLPLHDPIRVAESWGMIDVLSGGRVGLSIATGWRSEDFVLAPGMYAGRKDTLKDQLETLRALWRGEAIERHDPTGRAVTLRTRPRPLQPELPVWLTCAGSPASFALAGELGTAVFTMIATDREALASNIAAYRASFARHWNGATGHVTVLVSTFVDADQARARATALAPLERYLASSLDIGAESTVPIPLAARRRFIRQKAERVIDSDGLIGDLGECQRRIVALAGAGADEIACLVDFGVEHQDALAGIARIGALAECTPARAARWARLPVPVPLEHRGRPEVWLLAKSTSSVEPREHRAVLVQDAQLPAELASSLDEHALSGIQFGIYFDELRFARATYNNPFVVRVDAVLEPERLRHAIRVVSLRHDMLRSRFVHRGDTLVRVVDAEPKVDLRVVNGCDGESAVCSRARIDAMERFDLAAAHPLRVELFPGGIGANHLLLCLHHIAGDVVSGFIVVRDILRAYDSFPAAPWDTARASVTYAHVAAVRDAASPEREQRLQRWIARTSGAPTTVTWPTVKPRPARLSGAGTQTQRVLEADRVSFLRAAARTCKVTVPTFMFAVLQALLHTKTGRRDLLVGAVSLGRGEPSWLGVVGPLFNMLPVRSTLAPGCSFERLAQRTGTALVETMVEDRIGFAEIVQRGRFPTTLDRSPLVQFLFNYIPKQGVADGADAGVSQIDLDWGIATFDVDVSVRERADQLLLTVKWSDDAMDAREGEAFALAFDALLARVTREPQMVLLRDDATAREGGSGDGWKEELADAPKGIALPIDGTATSGSVDAVSSAMPPHVTKALLDLARQNGLAPHALFLATFAAWLARHSGQDDLVVACTTTVGAERALHADLGGVGAFAMARLRVDPASTFQALALSTACIHQAAEAREPLAATAHAPAGDLSVSGVSVLFAFHQHDDGTAAPTTPTLPPGVAIGLEITLSGEEATARFVFDAGVFAPATVARFERRYATLLAAAVGDFAGTVVSLAMLPAEELSVLEAWNDTDQHYDADTCAHELIAAQARRAPDAVAVVDDHGQLTYGELDRRAEALAAHLHEAGVGLETRVALAVRRSAQMVVGLLGIQKSAGAYVPIDLGLPRERIRAMLEEAGVTHVVTESDALEHLPATDARVLLLDRAEPGGAATRRTDLRATGASLAYVMFTSGSTGRPKGVEIPHRALVNFLHSMRNEPGIESSDVMLAVTTLSFDISGLELYLPLTVGASVVIASPEAALGGDQLARLMENHHVTMLQATPTTYRLLLAAGWTGAAQRRLLVGGEAVPADLVAELVARSPSVWNMYGPTETTIWSTCARLEASRVVIGKPIANTRVYVLGASLERLAVGVKGELYIGGDGLARGYIGRPELTAERFVPNPFGDARSPVLYRTGDLARMLPGGDLECLGRIDSQVKLRGFRVELGEIEHVLGTNPALKGAVVLLREDTPGDKRLVAYVVGRSRTAKLSATELGDHARSALPAYMVPSAFVLLDALPLSASGKVDRKALAALDLGAHRAAPATAYEMPANEIEGVLTSVWSEVLGVERVGRNDNFFDLGGNSLLALQAHGKLTGRLGKEFPILNVFAYTTVSSLASYLAEMDHNGAAKPATTVNRNPLLEQGALRRAKRKTRSPGGES